MNERLRVLREDMKLSRAAFGDKLGVSGDVINNLERGRVEIKDHIVKLICAEYSVNEEWLRTGTGDMYASDEAEYSALIDRIMTGQNEFAKNIFKTFALFDEKDWEALQAMIEKYLNVSNAEGVPEEKTLYDDVPDTPEELEKLYPPVDNGDNSDVG